MIDSLPTRAREHIWPEPTSGCWLWGGPLNSSGYGNYSTGPRKARKYIQAHRLVWESINGPIPIGLYVLHCCDNRACCNPDHLFLGTHQDNMDDMVRKGRHVTAPQPGETNPSSRLTERQVIWLRMEWHAGTPITVIARELNVCESTVRFAAKSKTWKHLPPAAALAERGEEG